TMTDFPLTLSVKAMADPTPEPASSDSDSVCLRAEKKGSFGDDAVARLDTARDGDVVARRVANRHCHDALDETAGPGGHVDDRLRSDTLHRRFRHQYDRTRRPGADAR